ncbi:MarR family winged helix-turn-helix transcriptional regulator [Pseudonocardia zijingensis]|uniref:HTH marR-type domain-containing protein n=1 Tax=Pseudonocardia zijingensis TaxID=153376 RepID=A0ABP4ADI3_9PSEU
MTDPETEALGDAELLSVTASRLVRLQTEVLENLEIPLTYRQERTLTRVQQGYTSVISLARLANLTLPTVSETVSVLVRRGLISRQEDPKDRRLSLLELTPLGVKALAAARTALEEAMGGLFDGLDDRARREFLASLEHIRLNARKWFAGHE